MLKIDYHMHTDYSFDSKAKMEEMIKRAIDLQLTEIAVTDHIDYSYPSLDYLYPINFENYTSEFKMLKEKYEDRIHLTLGIEIGMGSKIAKNISELIHSQPFDFVIGSQHDYEGLDVCYSDFYEGKTKRQAYTQFLQEMVDCVKAIPEFNIVGHIDYIARYGQYDDKTLSYYDFTDIIDLLLTTIIRCGKGIEINTSGIRYNLGHTHPHFDIIKRYKQLGGEMITVGSDAHKPEDIATHFDLAYEYLTVLGFKAVTVFRDRKPVMAEI